MIRALLAASALFGATAAAAFAQAVPLPNPPPPGGQTATMIRDAMMAVARAAAVDSVSANAAAISYRQAISRLQSGDPLAARAFALEAIRQADRVTPRTPIPVMTPVPLPPLPSAAQPFPIQGADVARVDADAFVAQARGAVAACRSAQAGVTAQALARLTAAQQADAKGDYQTARADARTAVDLCAPYRR